MELLKLVTSLKSEFQIKLEMLDYFSSTSIENSLVESVCPQEGHLLL